MLDERHLFTNKLKTFSQNYLYFYFRHFNLILVDVSLFYYSSSLRFYTKIQTDAYIVCHVKYGHVTLSLNLRKVSSYFLYKNLSSLSTLSIPPALSLLFCLTSGTWQCDITDTSCCSSLVVPSLCVAVDQAPAEHIFRSTFHYFQVLKLFKFVIRSFLPTFTSF